MRSVGLRTFAIGHAVIDMLAPNMPHTPTPFTLNPNFLGCAALVPITHMYVAVCAGVACSAQPYCENGRQFSWGL